MALLTLYTDPSDLAAMFGSLTILGIVFYPLMRALARRIEGKPQAAPALSAGSDARLERMEQAIEAVAVEVERISEAQRFQTKLLAERAPNPVEQRRG